MDITRRSFLQQSAVGAAVMTVLGVRADALPWTDALRRAANIKIGGTDWSMRLEGKIEAFAAAKEAARSEERRVGKECTSWCRSRWSPYH